MGNSQSYVVPLSTQRQIMDIVKRTWSPPLRGPWPPGARRMLEREYTR